MSLMFDPYHIWLGIPPEEQPPDHYRLLGIRRFESNENVIANAADQRMSHIRTFQTGKNGAASQAILNQLAAARLCLLNAEKKSAYDETLRAEALRAQAPSVPPTASESGIHPPARPLPVPVNQLVTRPPGPVNTPPRAMPVAPHPPADSRIWVDTRRRSASRPFWRSPGVLAGGLVVALGLATAMSLGLFDGKENDSPAIVGTDAADDATGAADPIASTHSETDTADRPVEALNDVAGASEANESAESAQATPPHPSAGTDLATSDASPPRPVGGPMDLDAAMEIVESAGILSGVITRNGRKEANGLRFSTPQHARLDDEVLRALTSVRTVIIDSALGDAALSKVALLPRLRSVQISSSATSPPVSPVALRTVAGIPELDVLEFLDARVATGALAELRGAKGLQYLRLPEGVRDDELIPLRELRPRIVSLSSSLTDNCLDVVGQWPLVRLNTRNARITDQGILRLAESPAVGTLSTLIITDAAVSSRGMESIVRLPQLRTLHISAEVVRDGGLAPLQQSKLTTLLLSGDGRPIDTQLEPLSKLPALKSLTLNNSCVSDAGLKHVANCSLLRFLVISDCPQVSDQGLTELKALSQLRTLSISRSSVTQEGRQALQQALPNLRLQ